MNFILNKKLLYYFCVFVFLCFCVFNILSINFCQAQSIINSSSEKYQTGDYELNDFVQIFINYYERVLGIVGSLALLMFIYGGFMFLISSGNSEKVTQAKQIIVSAVIGLVIVFASYMIIQFIFTALEIPKAGEGGWADPNSGWFK